MRFNPSSVVSFVPAVSLVLFSACNWPTYGVSYRGVVTSGSHASYSFDDKENPHGRPVIEGAVVRLDSGERVQKDAGYCPPTRRPEDEPPTFALDTTDANGRFQVWVGRDPWASEEWVVLCVDAAGHERYTYRVDVTNDKKSASGSFLNIQLRRLPQNVGEVPAR